MSCYLIIIKKIKCFKVVILFWLFLFGLCSIGCSSIDKKSNLLVKQDLVPIVNPFNITKNLEYKVIDSNAEWLLNSAILFTKDKQHLYIGGVTGTIKSLDFNGKLLWKKDLKNAITAGPVVFKDQVLVATSTQRLFCLNAINGAIIWEAPMSSELLAAPLIDANTAFLHNLDGSLAAIDLKDGQQLWRVPTASSNITLRRGAAPVSSDDKVIAGFANGKLFALDKEQGVILWGHNISNPKGRIDLQRITDLTADPVIMNNIVYAISYQGNLVAIEINTGELLWQKEFSCYSGITLENKSLYIATKEGKVLGINNKTGDVLWEQNALVARTLSKPVVFNEYLVIGDEDGNLHFLDKLSGATKGRIFLNKSGISLPPLVIGRNDLYILTNTGYLIAISIK